ncbi:segmentation polarity homeobox protein engrailed [Drosophila persimilis]|uniref:segmentation polarity homeobox protein engrailed n=1 Tax=Drosophila persimilis TaxID=7234 RepID=UPI000F0827EC|nr:segmentation polarity homeobox protein engrailed [Drosophila persimilis]
MTTNQTACALQENQIPVDSYRMHSKPPPTMTMGRMARWPLLLLLLVFYWCSSVAAFGNEYVHIKVHVPKEQGGEPEVAKVIHHYHHHPHPHQLQRLQRGRGAPPPPPPPPKPKHPSPLLESVILSDLDKPLHMSEHAEYLNHAKELADHLTESFNKKPPPPPPLPLPPKKKVNTYTIIEEQHSSRPAPAPAPVHSGYGYEDHPEHSVETYRVIESRPQLNHHHHHKQHHAHLEEDDDDLGYHYPHSSRSYPHHIGGAYAEPAPVEEHIEQETETEPGYSYSAPYAHSGRGPKSGRAPAYTLEAPEESSSAYGYDYSRPSSSSSGSSSGFRPSPQLPSGSEGYEDEVADTYGAPAPARRRRPALVDWPEATGFNSAAPETYNGVDSYNVGHVQGFGSGGYQYSGPYL